MDKLILWFTELMGTIKAISSEMVTERLTGKGFARVKEEEGEVMLLTLSPDLARFAAFLDIQSEAIGNEQTKGEEDLRRMLLEGRPASELKAFHKKLEKDLELRVHHFSDLVRLFWIAVREEYPGIPEDGLRIARRGFLVKTLPEEPKRPMVGVTVIEVPAGGDILSALRDRL